MQRGFHDRAVFLFCKNRFMGIKQKNLFYAVTLDLLDLNGSNGFAIVGAPLSYNQRGVAVAGIGDFNNDTRPDFTVVLQPFMEHMKVPVTVKRFFI